MKLWTIQPSSIAEQLQEGITFICDENKSINYRDKIFREAYDWMIKQMDIHGITRINDAKYPVWGWYRYNSKHRKPDLRESGYATRGTKMACIGFEISEKDVLLSDFDDWHFVLSDMHMSPAQNEEELEKYDAYFKSLSPEIQKRVKEESWNDIFDITPRISEWRSQRDYIQAVMWEIRPEMVKNIQYFLAR